MFDRFFERIGWKKKTDDIIDETYVPYQGPVDRELEKLFDVTKEAPKIEEPISDPPPSMDFLNKPEIKLEPEIVDPLVNAVVTELSKEDVKTKQSSKAAAPRKKDPLVAATAKELSKKPLKKKKPVADEEDNPKKSKKKAVRKTVKKKSKK